MRLTGRVRPLPVGCDLYVEAVKAAIVAAAANSHFVRIGAIRHAEMLQDARMSGLGKLRAAPDIVVNGHYGPILLKNSSLIEA